MKTVGAATLLLLALGGAATAQEFDPAKVLEQRLALEAALGSDLKQGLREALAGKTQDADALAALATRLETEWQQRPEWGELVIPLLRGEHLKPGLGWWQASERRHGWSWFRRFDRNGDDCVEAHELPELPQLGGVFARLDRDRSASLTSEDIEPAIDAKPGDADRAAARLFRRADRDSNGRATPDELLDLLLRADPGGSGWLTAEDLAAALDDPPSGGGGSWPPVAHLLAMLFGGEMGSLDEGPEIDAPAPEVRLQRRGGRGEVRLSSLVGSRPVVLVFGSFT